MNSVKVQSCDINQRIDWVQGLKLSILFYFIFLLAVRRHAWRQS